MKKCMSAGCLNKCVCLKAWYPKINGLQNPFSQVIIAISWATIPNFKTRAHAPYETISLMTTLHPHDITILYCWILFH